ncbi:PP2C family protein-serine/threonine phosphatase [Corynebacterium uterequi]|uniref:Serine/threonine protein phosphatase n=1 Tax=Corynebacterium uterequi TaxID=1072256 RepID=A0A0G3HDM7_9CORY|nr:protein phosphatase 2C domain-containing protein [Corynebacterium uterequi]AKK10073.1 serine/threonine protein phosphatase [Corynebacterium uterequi]
MTLRLHYTVASDKGLVRGNNEDSAYAGPHLLILADGMGGHAAGEVASSLMVGHLEKLDRDPEDNDMLALLGSFADDANKTIAEQVRRDPATEGMGTTLTAILHNGAEAGLIHVGDSRGYRLRDGSLEQLTIDDTFVQSLVDEGKLDPADVSSHPKKSLILKAYTGIPVEPTLSMLDLRPGDRLLLCSDGLSDPVTASTIEAALGEGGPEQAAARLVELALRSGGPDNVTVVVAEVVDDDALDDATRRNLPTAPMMGGAITGEDGEKTHPDTAAGRAAALRDAARRTPEAIAPAVPDQSPRIVESYADVASDEPTRGTKVGRWLWSVVAALVLTAFAATGWWAYSKIDDSFFVATDEQGQFVVEQGVNYTVFGRDLHRPVQQACLTPEGDLGLVEAGGKDQKDCRPFTAEDLPQPDRAAATSLPSGSYADVTAQLGRLADAALPVCLEVDPGQQRPGGVDENKPEGSTPDPAAHPVNRGDLSQPGVNCRKA